MKRVLVYLQRYQKRMEQLIIQKAQGMAYALSAAATLLILTIIASSFYALGYWILSPSPPPVTATYRSMEIQPNSHPVEASTDRTPSPDFWQTVTIKKGENPIHLFKSLGLSTQLLHDILTLGEPTYVLAHLQPGQKLRFLIDHGHQLQQLLCPINLTDTLLVQKEDQGYQARILHQPLTRETRFAKATIQHSLFAAGNKVHLSDNMLTQMTQIFGWDIDFAKDVRPGDHFSLLYEVALRDGKKVRDGDILEAEFHHKDQTYRAVRFIDSKGSTHYYTPEGMSMQRPFLRTPVKYTRISSHFTVMRAHPILHLIRAHKGVDYAAPRGTPIRASGRGKIMFIGRKGGYGNVIILKHGAQYSTLYGHMSGFAHGLKKYSNVQQGQIIGYVGMTGLATGPHLHYEFRINGVHRDPLTVKLPRALPIPSKERATFLEQTDKIMQLLSSTRRYNQKLTPESLLSRDAQSDTSTGPKGKHSNALPLNTSIAPEHQPFSASQHCSSTKPSPENCSPALNAHLPKKAS